MKSEKILILIILCLAFLNSGCTKNNNPEKHNPKKEKTEFHELESSAHLPSCGERMEFFSSSPLNFSEFTEIVPLGSVSPPSHIFPIDHMYIGVKRDVNENPIETSVTFPGDAWVTEIRGSVYDKNYPPDYTVYFSPCKEVRLYFSHLTSISDKLLTEYEKTKGNCQTENHGGIINTTCEKRMSLKVSEGELLGGSGGERPVFDIGATDSRNKPLQYANQKRWQKYFSFLYSTCPLDYFTKGTREKLESRIGENQMGTFVKSTMNPICGDFSKDIPGTAQGIWFIEGTKKITPEDAHLALVPYHFYQTRGVFAVGSSIPGIKAERYYFNYQDDLVNKPFKDIKPGNVYCYEPDNENFTILLELVDKDNLKIEKSNSTTCDNSPWIFSNPVNFER